MSKFIIVIVTAVVPILLALAVISATLDAVTEAFAAPASPSTQSTTATVQDWR